MQSTEISSNTPTSTSIEVEEQVHAYRIGLAKQMIAFLDVAITARAYSNAVDASYGSEVYESSVRDDSRTLLQSFVDGKTLLGISTLELEEKFIVFKKDAKHEARYAKRLRLWTRLFEIVFGKANFRSAMKSGDESRSPFDFGPMLLGISLALATIMVARAF